MVSGVISHNTGRSFNGMQASRTRNPLRAPGATTLWVFSAELSLLVIFVWPVVVGLVHRVHQYQGTNSAVLADRPGAAFVRPRSTANNSRLSSDPHHSLFG